jgi:isocitrate dehydrogenase kinase/phosphatase
MHVGGGTGAESEVRTRFWPLLESIPHNCSPISNHEPACRPGEFFASDRPDHGAGFDKHYRLFRECSASAKGRFERAEWIEGQQAMRERIQFYDDRVRETVEFLQSEFDTCGTGREVWQEAKLLYIGLLTDHKQPELAETFFNSVFCQMMHRTYFHNDFIFVRPAISTEYIESDPPIYRCYYPNESGFRSSIAQVFRDFSWDREFEDLDRDVEYICEASASIWAALPGAKPICRFKC